jgi:putative ABC transport system permease protein
MSTLIADIRYGLRTLRKNRGFTAVTVLTLALGIGANTAIFTVVNAVLLEPLPYPGPDRIVQINQVWKDGAIADALTASEYEFYRDHTSAFQALAGFRGGPDLPLKRSGATEWLTSLRVTDGFFQALGVAPALGRGILRDETRPGSAPAVILSDSVWHKAFGGSPAVLGQQLEMGDTSYTIAGVMPPRFQFVGQPADVFIPLQFGNGVADTGMNTSVIGRVRPGVSLGQAQANLDVAFSQMRAHGLAQSGQRGGRVISYQTYLAGDLRASLLMLLGAVGLLLLIACANVASLIMARANVRQREISIRLALGAERLHLLRQFLAESLLIALIGGAAGVVTAAWALRVLVSSIPWDVPTSAHISLDARVLAFALALSLATSVVFGFTSYWQTSRSDPNASLKEGGTEGGRSSAGSRTRNGLVVGEIALSLMLLVGAGLLIESLYRLHQQKLGFDPEHVYTMTTPFPRSARLTPAQIWTFEQQALDRIKAIPGVSSAAVVSLPPLTCCNNLPTQLEGHPDQQHSIGGMEQRAISPEYFQAMHISLLQGRGFRDSDTASATPVAIVSETVARAWWGGRSPIGDRIVVGEYAGKQFPDVLEPPREVVGVAADAKNTAVDEAEPTTVYVPASQLYRADNSTAWVVRATGSKDIATALRRAVAEVNPDQRVLGLESMPEIVARSIARPSFDALLMGIFAALALALTSVGIYGVLSFHVSRRTQEIGIRVALGAKPRNVVLMVIREGAVLAAVGIALGLAGALALSRFLASLLSGIQTVDAAVYGVVVIVLLGIALLASYVPARRASRVDPLVALRYE